MAIKISALIVSSFFAIFVLLGLMRSSREEVIDLKVKQMIEQDHFLINATLDYITEMQEKGVLPKREK